MKTDSRRRRGGESGSRRSALRAVMIGALALLALGSLESRAGDWPQFRGPLRDGLSSETGLPASWPERGPAVRWRRTLGAGYSGISVVGDRLYTMYAVRGEEFVIGVDAATGRNVWNVPIDRVFVNNYGDGPRSTPTVQDGVVYALGAKGKLVALAAADGSEIWSRELAREFGAKPPEWGVSTSPLVEGKRLLVDVGGRDGASIVAFDVETGEELWRSGSDKAGYSAPLPVTIHDRRQVVFLTATRLVALSPSSGEPFWQVPWETSYDVNASTPVFVPPDKIFVSTGYDVGAALYRVTFAESGAEVQEIWKNREMRNKFSSSVLHEGHLYGFDEKSLKCIDAASGAPRWAERGFGHGSLFYADGHLIVLSEDGTLLQVAASPDAFVVEGQLKLFDGRSWTVPTLAGGRLYARDAKEIVSLQLSE